MNKVVKEMEKPRIPICKNLTHLFLIHRNSYNILSTIAITLPFNQNKDSIQTFLSIIQK